MEQNFNKGKLGLKDQGPVWKVKIGIHSGVTENKIEVFDKTKKWKMKVILN
ncbi:hypothetical protein OU798_09170 [Prolixibacteraceae bacterium Z1-6]|uniref:Uncharacterized protein n=1 Tax=Draconibacterium aestuarii TaxID=2998507 RepID=A0A9X3J7B1_9BACT|nr:hypothetical protein [Prolixibacteraceae bacterium Z1-6]